MVYKRRGSERSQSVSSVVEQLTETGVASGRSKPYQPCLWKQETAKKKKTSISIHTSLSLLSIYILYFININIYIYKTIYEKRELLYQNQPEIQQGRININMSRTQSHMDECCSPPALFQICTQEVEGSCGGSSKVRGKTNHDDPGGLMSRSKVIGGRQSN